MNQQKNVKQLKQYTHIIKDSSNDYNKNLILNKIKTLNVNNKIYLYKFLKNKMKMKWNIIYHIQIEMLRLILTKFRLSEHNLLIEIGRNFKIPRDQRLCDLQCLGR